VVQSFNVVQHKNGAIAVGQLLDGAFEIQPGHRLVPRRQRLVPAVFFEPIGQYSHPRLPAPDEIEALVHRQPVEPGAERRITAETPELSMHV